MNIRQALIAAAFLLCAAKGQAQAVTDTDMNVYNTVTIGQQTWLAENLKTTKLADGTPIAYANGVPSLQNFTPSYTWSGYNEEAAKSRYGALYNWYAVETKKLCPAGWHVPTDKEWTDLSEYLEKNAFGVDGSGNDIAKSLASKAGWNVSQEPGTTGHDQAKSNNRSGFSALPGGVLYFNGKADSTGSCAFWWSSTEFYTTNAWSRGLMHNKNYIFRLSYGKRTHMSVRCIKD